MKKQKFNKWTVLGSAGKDKWGSYLVNCRCDCGNTSVSRLSDLKYNKSIQCITCGHKFGKKGIEILKSPLSGKGNNHRHGKYYSPTYKAWAGMINRCSSKGKAYQWYGSRNITVCKRWLKFEYFYKDMGDKPEKYYLDRIDNDLGYFKKNCRWVDALTNSRNRRGTKYYKNSNGDVP